MFVSLFVSKNKYTYHENFRCDYLTRGDFMVSL